MPSQKMTFTGSQGDTLAARLDLPDDAGNNTPPRAYALFAHCFTCSKNLGAAVQLSRALVERGWAVLRFDFTGLGDSEGDFADTHFSSNVDDLVAAAEWLQDSHVAPTVLIGHSLGGAVAIQQPAHHPGETAVFAPLAGQCVTVSNRKGQSGSGRHDRERRYSAHVHPDSPQYGNTASRS